MEQQNPDQQPQEDEQPRRSVQGPAPSRQLPPDFANRVATKVVFTHERERDPDRALEKIAGVLLRNVSQPDRLSHMIDVVEVLENDDETRRHAGLALVSVVLNHQEDPTYERFVSDFVDQVIHDHQHALKPQFQLEYRRRHFSAYARILGEAMIAMMEVNSELYEVVSHYYSLLIRKEMGLEQARQEGREGRRISVRRGEGEVKVGKKLFDDVVDYIHARGEQRSGTLQQQNPNEYISILADRMRGTRRYVIQDMLNKQALAKRKQAEKELSERLASAEEIVKAKDAFKRGVHLFLTEKRYNFKYLAVEKVRVTVQVIAVLVGIAHFLAAYLGMFGMVWWEGVVVAVGMYLFARMFCSRAFFRRFFPEDVSKDLELVVGSFTATFRKMSKDQLDAFLARQVRDPENFDELPVLPEFIKYVFAVMPDRRNVIVQRDELAEIVSNMETDIARVVRTASPRQHG